MKQEKSFSEKYKETKIASLILIIFGPIFIISGSTSEWINPLNIIVIIFGISLFIYGNLYFFLYWKYAKYQKNAQIVPNWFRITTAIFCSFYLTFYNLKESDKKSRLFILAKEIRFYVLLWIFLMIILITFEFALFKEGKTFWLLISLLIVNVIWVIDLIIMIFIWKYKGTNSTLLKVLSIVTLNYRNYRLYETIINLNEKVSN